MEKISLKPITLHEDDRRSSLYDLFGDELTGQINLSYSRETETVVGWHKHQIGTDHWFCVKGAFKVGLHEDNTRITWLTLTDRNPKVLTIRPGVWHGWRALEPGSVMLYYLSDKYDDTDCERVAPGAFNEDWRTESK